MTMTDWQIGSPTHDRLGESILWHAQEQALYWIDFYGPLIHRLKQGVLTTWRIGVGKMIGSLVFVDDGRLLLAVDRSLHLFDPATGETVLFANPSPGPDKVAYNDGKVDRAGRYWLGTYEMSETEPLAAFYRVSAGGVLTMADSGFVVCNGPAFSPDNRILYFSDSVGRRILAYDLDAGGNLSRRRTFIQFPADGGLPDGLAVDSGGDLWCALYGAGRIVRIDPAGEVKLSFPVPEPNVTSLCFGGADLKTLFITTGWRNGTTAETRQKDTGGCMFMRPVDRAGLPEPVLSLRAPC